MPIPEWQRDVIIAWTMFNLSLIVLIADCV
jgi:hypothetical protein